MTGAVLGGILGGVGSLAQLGMGIASRRKAKKTLNKAQSFYRNNPAEIPESAKAALANAERQAQSPTLPAEDLRRAQMGQVTAQGVGAAQSAATSSSDVLGVLSSLYGNQMMGEQNLAIQGAERFDRNQSALRGELGRMAGEEKRIWDLKVRYPYEQMLGQAEAYGQRGAQEISGAFGALGQIGGDIMQGQSAENQYMDFLSQMGLGQQSQQSTPYNPAYSDINQQQKPYY